MDKQARKKRMHLWTLAALILLIPLFAVALRQDLRTAKYTIGSDKVKNEVRIVMLSDLHGSFYGKDQRALLERIDALSPHAILLAGDIFDEGGDFLAAEALFEGIAKKYPCYYVSGNHEYPADFAAITAFLQKHGIICLWGQGQTVTLNGQPLYLAGLADENHTFYVKKPLLPLPKEQLAAIEAERSKEEQALFSILLCHRPHPELFKDSGYELVLSGHNHGGQVRIPWLLNGLFAPGEGFFPKYGGGSYEMGDDSLLIVGRGLAKSNIPRIFNRPEVVLVTITPEQ